jgi:hypothetical protein
MKNTSAPTLKLDKQYIVRGINGAEQTISGRTPAEALGVFLKRGRYGLGSNWMLTRQPDGWIVATNKGGRNLERTQWKLREVNYVRGMR